MNAELQQFDRGLFFKSEILVVGCCGCGATACGSTVRRGRKVGDRKAGTTHV